VSNFNNNGVLEISVEPLFEMEEAKGNGNFRSKNQANTSFNLE
jgi:hypothetical protein